MLLGHRRGLVAEQIDQQIDARLIEGEEVPQVGQLDRADSGEGAPCLQHLRRECGVVLAAHDDDPARAAEPTDVAAVPEDPAVHVVVRAVSAVDAPHLRQHVQLHVRSEGPPVDFVEVLQHLRRGEAGEPAHQQRHQSHRRVGGEAVTLHRLQHLTLVRGRAAERGSATSSAKGRHGADADELLGAELDAQRHRPGTGDAVEQHRAIHVAEVDAFALQRVHDAVRPVVRREARGGVGVAGAVDHHHSGAGGQRMKCFRQQQRAAAEHLPWHHHHPLGRGVAVAEHLEGDVRVDVHGDRGGTEVSAHHVALLECARLHKWL